MAGKILSEIVSFGSLEEGMASINSQTNDPQRVTFFLLAVA